MADNRKSDFDPSLWWQGMVVNSNNYDPFGNQDTFLAKIISNVETVESQLFFYVRILDEDMAHIQYLEDPCSLSETSNNPITSALLTYGLHSQVSIRADIVKKSLGKDDIIRIRCLRGQNGDKFSLQNVEFVELVTKTTASPPADDGCVSLAALDFNNGSTFSNNSGTQQYSFTSSPEQYNINNFTFESIPVPSAVQKAVYFHKQIGVQGFNGYGVGLQPGRTRIVETIHFPTYKAYRDQELPENWKKYYLEGGTDGKLDAWSSWFLMGCYIDQGVHFPQFEKNAKAFEISGCCYPNAMAARNRRDVFNSQDPARYINQVLLMVFSRQEMEAKPLELGLVIGDASIVGQGRDKPWEETRNEFQNVTRRTHMNVYVGQDYENSQGRQFIGGNLSNTTAYKDDLRKNSFCKLVRITGFNPNPTT